VGTGVGGATGGKLGGCGGGTGACACAACPASKDRLLADESSSASATERREVEKVTS
jgi:hypothetical protein